jgi:SAM-dependent methyltransferase
VVISGDWSAYLERFHADQAGITERILARCRSDGSDPYAWCAEPVGDSRGPVLDIACGSAPMIDHLHGWIGTDRSAGELATARAAGRGPLIRSSATQLAVAAGATDAVVCSMAMQVIQPVAAAIAEVSRVLRPGGRGVLLLPSGGPLGWRDATAYLRLQAALRRRIGYPNDHALARPRLAAIAASSGLMITSDERRAFSLPITSEQDIAELVQSLYLPGVDPGRLPRAERVLSRRIGTELAVPLRRVVLDSTGRSRNGVGWPAGSRHVRHTTNGGPP